MNNKGKTLILVVDDDPDVLNTTSLLLKEFGYSTVTRDNAKDAIDVIEKNDIDIVLTDIVMPGSSGIELLGEIHNIDPEIPVILMTAYADLDKAVEAIKRDVFDFLIKPYKPEQLLHSVNKAIRYNELINFENDYKYMLEEFNRELETLLNERTMSLMTLTVADRIRNPVAVIGLKCKRILEKENFSNDAEKDLNDIKEEVKKLDRIVSDFQTILKSKKSMFSYNDINEIVNNLISVIGKDAVNIGVELIINLSEEPLKINMQKNQLRAAIFHVMRNAIEATPEGGRVTISTFRDNDNAVLTVSDTGHGIPKKDLENIFDPFFSTKEHRYGMGLSLVKQIVTEHFGKIKVDSEVYKGTTFILIFPLRWKEG